MAKLPRRRSDRLAHLAFAAMLLVATAGSADRVRAEPVDLIGTWHVLIHYTDDHSHDPTLMRWDEKVWVFETSGSRLRWTEYPIVVFRDDTGRFEKLGGSRAARVLHGWEPNAGQRAQIEAGLEVNPRGSKSKTLRKEADGSWRSTTRPKTSAAMVISYIESWSIANPTTKPVFRREDTLGSSVTESYDGVTEYATTEVDLAAQVLRGTFERDGSRHGTFRMTRSGDAWAVKGKSRSEGQRFTEAFLGDGFHERLASIDLADAADAGARERVHAAVRSAIEAEIDERGADPAGYEREVESLARQITAQLLDAGRTPEEIQELLAEGRINP